MEMPASSLIRIRATLGVPMLRDNKVEGVLVLTRPEPGPFTKSQIDLVQTFADQAMIAIENARLFDEVQAKTADLSELLQHQTATSEVLQAIGSSMADTKPVFERILDSVERLFDTRQSAIFLVPGDGLLHAAARRGIGSDAFDRVYPLPVEQTAAPRVLGERRQMYLADLMNEADAPPSLRRMVETYGNFSVVITPMLWEGQGIGLLAISREPNAAFTPKELSLLKTFADQAVIAIQNARLFNETKEALERQTATADILKVIASSPSDVQPVFEAIAERSKRLVDALSTTVFKLVDGMMHLKAFTPTNPEADATLQALFPVPLSSFSWGEAIGQGEIFRVIDTEQEIPDIRDLARLRGFRSMLFVPLLRDRTPIGVIAVTRVEPGPFVEHHVQLLQTFADQAVIAIENARLFDEVQAKTADLEESLQHQTATSEVLKVISRSPGELDPVFRTILSSATSICDAQFGLLLLYEGGGFRCASMFNLPPAFAETFSRNPVIYPPPIDPLGRLIETQQLVHVVDVKQEPAFLTGFPPIVELVELGGARTLLLVPMLRESSLVGVIAIFRQTVHAFSDKQIDLVTSFGSQAVIAIENARLLNELRERTDDLSESLQQQTATSEVLQVISSSPGDLKPVFKSMLGNALRICEATFGNLLLFDGEGFTIAELHNTPEAFTRLFTNGHLVPGPNTGLRRLITGKQVVHIVDVKAESGTIELDPLRVVTAQAMQARTVLAVPMLKERELVGAIVIYRQDVRPFTEKQIELVAELCQPGRDRHREYSTA